MTLLEISGFPLFLLSMASIYFIYHLFKWIGSSNTPTKSIIKNSFKEYKSYQDCIKEARWIINKAEKHANEIKGKTIEEIDFEYDSMDDDQRLNMAEQRQWEIEELAKELYEKYNDKKFQ